MPVLTADLQAVAVADIAGQLQAEPPVSLRPEEYISFIGGSAISLVANRIAYMTGDRSDTSVPKTFWIADLVRDGTGRISGATNHRVLAQDDEIGSPSDVVGESVAATYAGGMAFSPDCASLLVVVYADLWRLYLAADGSLLYPDRVTQTRTRAESSPAFSPDGRKLAFAAVDLKLGSGPWKGQYVPGSVNIYTLDLGYAATPVPLLNKSNLGEAVANTTNRFSSPTWSPDGAFIAFSAPGAKSKPTSPCYGTNTDIFVIRSNGSGQATALVRTAGTGLEIWPHWGSE
jgi:Tol biopolymer transport system component